MKTKCSVKLTKVQTGILKWAFRNEVLSDVTHSLLMPTFTATTTSTKEKFLPYKIYSKLHSTKNIFYITHRTRPTQVFNPFLYSSLNIKIFLESHKNPCNVINYLHRYVRVDYKGDPISLI